MLWTDTNVMDANGSLSQLAVVHHGMQVTVSIVVVDGTLITTVVVVVADGIVLRETGVQRGCDPLEEITGSRFSVYRRRRRGRTSRTGPAKRVTLCVMAMCLWITDVEWASLSMILAVILNMPWND